MNTLPGEQKPAILELRMAEIEKVCGGGIAYDLAHAAGRTVGGWFNAAQESIHNDPFRRQFQSR